MKNADHASIPYRLTVHARKMIAERKISSDWIGRVLAHPLMVEQDREDPELRHALGRIPEHGDRILRVIYNATMKPWSVITAFFDRRMGGVL